MSTPIEELGFVEAIYDDPYSDGPRQVYADWLEERGDPRTEYLRLQLSGSSDEERANALRRQFDPKWVNLVSRPPVRVGDQVRIREGLYAGMMAQVVRVNVSRACAGLALLMFCWPAEPIEVEFGALQRVGSS